jgi:hypothetical protein
MKQTPHTSAIKVPRILVYGPGDVNMREPHVFGAKDVAPEIVHPGNSSVQYRQLQEGSMTLGDQAALFNAYMYSLLFEYELPAGMGSQVNQLFGEAGVGTVANNACDFDNGDIGLVKPKNTDAPVMWTVYPHEFVRMGEGWMIKTGEASEQFPSHLPKSGYAEMTFDGYLMPESGRSSRPRGVPFSTVNTKKAAVDSWVRAGFQEDLANELVSYFSIRRDRRGVAVVIRHNDYARKGPFSTTVTQYPDDMLLDIGSLLVGQHARQCAYA